MTSIPSEIQDDLERLKLARFDEFPEEAFWSKIEGYTQCICRWSSRINLVSLRDLPTIATKHFSQALAMVPIIKDLPHQQILDLGSGAGLPAIPLKIALPDAHFILIESRRKRANFLREVIRSISLDGIEVVNGRIEDWVGRPGGADLITARAVAAPDKLVGLVQPHLAPGGWILSPMPPDSNYKAEKTWRIEEGPMGTTIGLYR